MRLKAVWHECVWGAHTFASPLLSKHTKGIQDILWGAGGDAQPAEVCRLAAEIRGIPPLLRFSQLPDRRHVLTQDSEGQLARWDVTCGAIKDNYGKVNFFSTS